MATARGWSWRCRTAAPTSRSCSTPAAPEDAGGPHRYNELLAALRDPTNARDRELLDWIGPGFDPKAFDRATVNATLAALEHPARGRTLH